MLSGLGIPHATLLDLDIWRKGGGFGRIKTAIEQLIAIGHSRDEVLKTEGGVLSTEEFARMHEWSNEHLDGWVELLKRYSVYFSSPLDLDLAMLKAFRAAYSATIPLGGGPELTVDEAAKAVLSKGGLAAYEGDLEDYKALLPDYRYHFLTHSKPATHLRALLKSG